MIIFQDVFIPNLVYGMGSSSEILMTAPKILLPLAHGFEEIEAVTVIDILRRAGADLTIAALQGKEVTGGHDITITCDAQLGDLLDRVWDWIILPGGTEGVNRMLANDDLMAILKKHHSQQKAIAAICAAPLILDREMLTNGQAITIHPAIAPQIQFTKIDNQPVIKKNLLITGRSAGAAMTFAFTLVKEIFGHEKAIQLNKGVMAELPANF